MHAAPEPYKLGRMADLPDHLLPLLHDRWSCFFAGSSSKRCGRFCLRWSSVSCHVLPRALGGSRHCDAHEADGAQSRRSCTFSRRLAEPFRLSSQQPCERLSRKSRLSSSRAVAERDRHVRHVAPCRKRKASFLIPEELYQEARDAVAFLGGPPLYLYARHLAEEALGDKTFELKRKHNKASRFRSLLAGSRRVAPSEQLVSRQACHMPITDKTRKILWGRSGNRCAICKRELVVDATPGDDESVVGDECHIISESKPEGSRNVPGVTIEEADSYQNLVLLAKIHHKIIDDQVNKYPASELNRIKHEHTSPGCSII